MTSDRATRQAATTFLENVRADLQGWTRLDIARLLEAWGFQGDELDTGTSWRPILYHHPDHPDLQVTLSPEVDVHAAVARIVIAVIDELAKRQQG